MTSPLLINFNWLIFFSAIPIVVVHLHILTELPGVSTHAYPKLCYSFAAFFTYATPLLYLTSLTHMHAHVLTKHTQNGPLNPCLGRWWSPHVHWPALLGYMLLSIRKLLGSPLRQILQKVHNLREMAGFHMMLLMQQVSITCVQVVSLFHFCYQYNLTCQPFFFFFFSHMEKEQGRGDKKMCGSCEPSV